MILIKDLGIRSREKKVTLSSLFLLHVSKMYKFFKVGLNSTSFLKFILTDSSALYLSLLLNFFGYIAIYHLTCGYVL